MDTAIIIDDINSLDELRRHPQVDELKERVLSIFQIYDGKSYQLPYFINGPYIYQALAKIIRPEEIAGLPMLSRNPADYKYSFEETKFTKDKPFYEVFIGIYEEPSTHQTEFFQTLEAAREYVARFPNAMSCKKQMEKETAGAAHYYILKHYIDRCTDALLQRDMLNI